MVAAASVLLPGTPPIPRTRLIGREDERATARALLIDEAVPLLTLVGPGGVGKTRLALAIAEDVTASFADGPVWVDLAPVMGPTLAPGTLAAALALTPAPNHPLMDALARRLQPRQTLLLLDNCEHVIAAVAELVSVLLEHCPAMQVLATSRTPLRVRGEQILPVPALAVPSDGITTVDDIRPRVIGTTFPKAAWHRRTRNAALRSGGDVPRRIIHREPQHDRFYLFRPWRSWARR